MIGGTINLYTAYNIFETYRQDKELMSVLTSEGILLDHLSNEEKSQILGRVKELVSEKEFDQQKLIDYIESLK